MGVSVEDTKRILLRPGETLTKVRPVERVRRSLLIFRYLDERQEGQETEMKTSCRTSNRQNWRMPGGGKGEGTEDVRV